MEDEIIVTTEDKNLTSLNNFTISNKWIMDMLTHASPKMIVPNILESRDSNRILYSYQDDAHNGQYEIEFKLKDGMTGKRLEINFINIKSDINKSSVIFTDGRYENGSIAIHDLQSYAGIKAYFDNLEDNLMDRFYNLPGWNRRAMQGLIEWKRKTIERIFLLNLDNNKLIDADVYPYRYFNSTALYNRVWLNRFYCEAWEEDNPVLVNRKRMRCNVSPWRIEMSTDDVNITIAFTHKHNADIDPLEFIISTKDLTDGMRGLSLCYNDMDAMRWFFKINEALLAKIKEEESDYVIYPYVDEYLTLLLAEKYGRRVMCETQWQCFNYIR